MAWINDNTPVDEPHEAYCFTEDEWECDWVVIPTLGDLMEFADDHIRRDCKDATTPEGHNRFTDVCTLWHGDAYASCIYLNDRTYAAQAITKELAVYNMLREMGVVHE